jgi:hypothetical protein
VQRQIKEADWKHLRYLKPVALDRFCARVLSEMTRVAADEATSAHERYLSVVKLIEKRDRELAAAFDGLRRSTALLQLTHMRALELVNDAEFAEFSPETQQTVASYLDVWGARFTRRQ